MKKVKKYGLFFFAVVFSFLYGCNKKDYLNLAPNDKISEKEVFSNINNAKAFLSAAYIAIPSQVKKQSWMLSSACDESNQTWGGGNSSDLVNNGSWTPSTFLMSAYWDRYFSAIRRINIFFKNVDLIPETNPGDDVIKKKLRAEAHALRAYFYAELFRMWGGVPIIEEAYSPSNLPQLTRNTGDEVVAFIKKEIDLAIPDLVPTYAINADITNLGRFTQSACKFLLARTLLYYASPLHNPTGDANRWTAAANAAKAALDFAIASGHSLSKTATPNYGSYQRVFVEPNNLEIVFARNGFDGVDGNNNIEYLLETENAGGWNGIQVTQEMTDAYETKDGKSITDPTSGYNPQKPYENRDPRFDQTIIHHGTVWNNRTYDYRTGVGKDVAIGNPPYNQNLKKFASYGCILSGSGQNNGQYNQNRKTVLMRLAELYLNYAEAKNETEGPVQDVYDAVNTVRRRAPISDLPVGLSKDQMRIRIQAERRVELAFEDHRFFDVRRWKIAEQTENQPVHAPRPTGPTLSNVTYTYVEMETRSFKAPRDYLFPIPQKELDINPNFGKNPGW